MNRILSVVVCLSLLLGLSAASFAAFDEDGFCFQYGNRWGASIEDVRASIPEGKTVEDIIDWADETVMGLYVYDPDIFMDETTAYLTYLFDDDSLYAAVYHMYDIGNAFDAQVSLERLYGKGFISNDKAILLAGILNAAWEDTIYTDTLYYIIICWELQDGTTVLLTTHDQTFILVYYNLDYYTPNIIDDRL